MSRNVTGVMFERVGSREVVRLAWPIMVSMLSFTLMGVVDTLFVSQLGMAELAGVGLAVCVVHLMQGFGWGLLRGLKVVVSQRFGAQDTEAAARMVWQGLWLSGVLGVLVAGLGAAGEPILVWMGGSAEATVHGDQFLRVRLLGAPMLFAGFSLSAHFHGRGETRIPMVATLLGNGVNIVLDPVLIFGWWGAPALGVGGAALATIVGISVSTLFLLVCMAGTLWRTSSSFSAVHAREIWRVGFPIGAQAVLEVGSFTLFASMLAQCGDAHLAAHVVVIRIISVSFLPGLALGEAASVLVGQAVGASRPGLALQSWQVSVRLAAGVMLVMAVVFWLVPDVLLTPFGVSASVREVSLTLLRIAALFQLFDAIAMVGTSVLNGAGDTRFTMVVAVLSAWLVKLPLGALLSVQLELGASGAWWGLTAEIVVVSVVVLWRVQGRGWLSLPAAGAPACAK